jgi:hypothetical protein
MTRTVLAVLGSGWLLLSACGPLEDDGGGMVGAPCQRDPDCASNGCCGDGTAAVAVSQQPMCPTVCTNGRQPHSPCVNGDYGIVYCDSSSHCSVATSTTPSCTL